ncbi:uncharacterized protein LOC142352850 [Convolutriloba macropyga]|uniref:uncharacterized protein LOC142352850 n=1 Tax=Convolutriloba macropyga TaxID=536237 RepID=UPI003F5277B4
MRAKLQHEAMKPAPCLGVVRLDYDYPPAKGDIDCPDTFSYDVYYRAVPGLTFEMCQRGKLEDQVRTRFIEAIEWLIHEKKVSCITGDCGFMVYYQGIAQAEVKKTTSVPIVMSPLLQVSGIFSALGPDEDVIVMTANERHLLKLQKTFIEEFQINILHPRIHIVGCENVPGFEAVALGEKVDVEKVEPGIVELVREKLIEFPKTKAILMECTELPPYANAVREDSGLPVFDAITCCNFFIHSFQEMDRYGKQGWQDDWDGVQEDYTFGDNVPEDQKDELVNQPVDDESEDKVAATLRA